MPTKLKTCTIWPFTKKACEPLGYTFWTFQRCVCVETKTWLETISVAVKATPSSSSLAAPVPPGTCSRDAQSTCVPAVKVTEATGPCGFNLLKCRWGEDTPPEAGMWCVYPACAHKASPPALCLWPPRASGRSGGSSAAPGLSARPSPPAASLLWCSQCGSQALV